MSDRHPSAVQQIQREQSRGLQSAFAMDQHWPLALAPLKRCDVQAQEGGQDGAAAVEEGQHGDLEQEQRGRGRKRRKLGDSTTQAELHARLMDGLEEPNRQAETDPLGDCHAFCHTKAMVHAAIVRATQKSKCVSTFRCISPCVVVLQKRPDMRHQNNISGLLGAPQGPLVVRQLEENVSLAHIRPFL